VVAMARHSLILAALLALAAVAPAAASADVKQETRTTTTPAGEVRAELTYDKVSDFEYKDVRIKITRAGAVLLDALVPEPCKDCGVAPAGGGDPTNPSLRLTDLDANGEPEVLVDLFTGGAHCCSFTQIYGYKPATNSYGRTKGSWYDYGYTLRDLDGDGSPELESADWRFAGAFAAYAASGAPVQIWKYGNGKLNDVTRGFKSQIKSDLKQWVKLYKKIRKDPDVPDVRGFLAAYAADKYLLGQGDTAFDLINAANKRGELKAIGGDTTASGKKFISALRKYLHKTGYR
jgi:hypothetical protein